MVVGNVPACRSQNGLIATKLTDDDTLCWVSKCTDDCSVLVASERGMVLRFDTDYDGLVPHKRNSGGRKVGL